MGTEYILGCVGNEDMPDGKGVALKAYEMSGEFDVYALVPQERIDMEAWPNAAHVNLWDDIEPSKLFQIGLNIMEVASQWMDKKELITGVNSIGDATMKMTKKVLE